jgi:transcription factor E
MLKEFLKEGLVLAAGKPAESLADFLDTKKYVNEFLIAKKLELTINQTRNILYRISENGLVSSTRKKDKRKGWYTYFWKIEAIKTLLFLRNSLTRRIEQLENQIKSRETKEFYYCPRCNIEFSEENALLHDFTCIECGNILERKDNTKLISVFEKNLDKLKEALAKLDEEIRKERDVVEKKKEKEARKVEKEKAAKRAAKRAARKAAKKITKKKTTKKTSGKKSGKAAKKKTTKKKSAKTSKKTSKKAAKKSAKKSVKKTVKKSSSKKKTAKGTSKKASKKSKSDKKK